MKIAIVDNELKFLKEIERIVKTTCERFENEYQIMCYESPIPFIDEDDFSSYDIILLDIDMPQVNGIELASRINKIRCSEAVPYIIFVSAMDNLVFDALKQYPYSFVRKSHLNDIEECVSNIYEKRQASPVYAIKIGRTTKLIELDHILYLEKQGNYVNFFTTEGVLQERSLIDTKNKDLVQYGFLRPHIGAIVNPKYISDIGSNFLRLTNGKEISISRTYKKEFRAKHQEWLIRR